MFRADRLLLVTAAIVAVIGLFVRIYPFAGYPKVGFDEHIYESYVNRLSEGITYPALIRSYIETQGRSAQAFLPPTRVTFLSGACLLRQATGISSYAALHKISALFGILAVGVATVFAFRGAGLQMACGVLALMSVAPLAIHLSHRALIDGFFAFWTVLCLWTFWETLRRPRDRGWLLAYAASLACLVLTKENAAFVFMGLLAILVLNRWFNFGEINSRLLIATLAAPAAAVLLLIVLSGGAEEFFRAYLLNIEKSMVLPYAIKTGDGPWYRYLLDLLALSPLVTLLACGGLMQVRRENQWQIFLLLFLVVTYAVMANLRYGMNLRYGAIWDLPLRCFAFAQLSLFASRWLERFRAPVLAAMLLFVCAVDLRQYFVLFVRGAIYDPVPAELLRAAGILK